MVRRSGNGAKSNDTLAMKTFIERRRQPFLSEAAYAATTNFFDETGAALSRSAFTKPDFDANDRSLNADAYADETFANFLLKYTAGASIDLLRQDFEQVVSAFEQAARYVQEYAESPTCPPLRFIEIDEYERVLQLIGLSYLLHRRDLLPRIASIFDPSSAASDTLYEDLLAFGLDGRVELDTWYHDVPYRDLINCMYRDTRTTRPLRTLSAILRTGTNLSRRHLGMTAT